MQKRESMECEERGRKKRRETDDSGGICSAMPAYTSSVSVSLNNEPQMSEK
jgi:hypothetical protein